MNPIRIAAIAALSAVALTLSSSCSLPGCGEMKTEVINYADSSKYASVKFCLELPVERGKVSREIRKSLVSLELKNLYSESESLKEAVREEFEEIDRWGKEEYEMRVRDVMTDDLATQEERNECMAHYPGFYVTETLGKVAESRTYVVFSSGGLSYTGGAHCFSTGCGHLTYSKKDGRLFKAFIKPLSTVQMQKLIRQGLSAYFFPGKGLVSDEELFGVLYVVGPVIPLPKSTPYPTRQGLVFEYGEYEIACYAAGKPTFTLPYEDVRPYLTEQSVELLNLK